MLPIPAIDLIDGKCVRLTKGDYASRTTYRDDPVEVAREFADLGFPRLHLVDLDGARAGHVVNHRVLERIASATNLCIDFGGGLKTVSSTVNKYSTSYQACIKTLKIP